MSNRITQKQIDDIIKKSRIEFRTVYGKCTVASMQLPNGFVLIESSACVDPKNYDFEMGKEICMDKLVKKIWELEGYRLQNDIYNLNKKYKSYTVNELIDMGYDVLVRR